LRTKTVGIIICALLLATGFSSITVADWDPGDGHKMHYPQTPDPTSDGVAVSLTYKLADDFKCTESGPITNIHFWGAFEKDTVAFGFNVDTLYIRLYIYEDIPANSWRNWSSPGKLLWEKLFDPGDYTVRKVSDNISEGFMRPLGNYTPNDHKVLYQYNFKIDAADAYVQKEGTIYWLGIHVAYPPNSNLGWKSSDLSLQWNDAACWMDPWSTIPTWQPLDYPSGHIYEGMNLDFAFVINGPGLPPPIPIQPPPGYGPYMVLQEPDLDSWDVDATRTDILAEDFKCSEDGYIVVVTLWGSWENDKVGSITNFHLSMHNDIPVDTTAKPPILYSRPSKTLWKYDTGPLSPTDDGKRNQSWFSPSIPYWDIDDHTGWYRYDIIIPLPLAFEQHKGNIYWLAVQATTIGGVWGWKVSNRQVRDDAVYGLWDESAGDDPDLIEWHELIDPITNISLDMCMGLINKVKIPPIIITFPGPIPTLVNFKSQGRWISPHFEMPPGYDPADVDLSSLNMGGSPHPGCATLPVDWAQPTGAKKVLTKFDRSDLEDLLVPGMNNLMLSGQLKDGTELQGEYLIKAINPGK
jgi:hypothetical protein